MKTTTHLALALGLAALAASPASAHGCKSMRMRGYAMPGYMMPVAPVGGVVMPVGGANMSLSMSMAMSGDAAVAMGPILVGILQRLFGPPPVAMTEGRIR